jgi:integrase
LTGITDGTRKDYRQIAAMIATSRLGALPVQAVSRHAVVVWVRAMQDAGLAAKTIKNRHSLLSAALGTAVAAGTIPANPAKGVTVTRSIVEPAVFLTPAEFDVLYQRVTPHYRPLVRFLFGTGLRIGEATALTVADVDLNANPATVTVTKSWKRGTTGMVLGPPKTRKGRRTVSLPAQVVDDLTPLVAGRAPSDLLFVSQEGGVVRSEILRRKWARWRADTVWDPAARQHVQRVPALGKSPRVHDARHSHVSWLIAQGVDLPTIQQRLGHEHITTTIGTYGHLLPEAQVQAARAATLAFHTRPVAELTGSVG